MDKGWSSKESLAQSTILVRTGPSDEAFVAALLAQNGAKVVVTSPLTVPPAHVTPTKNLIVIGGYYRDSFASFQHPTVMLLPSGEKKTPETELSLHTLVFTEGLIPFILKELKVTDPLTLKIGNHLFRLTEGEPEESDSFLHYGLRSIEGKNVYEKMVTLLQKGAILYEKTLEEGRLFLQSVALDLKRRIDTSRLCSLDMAGKQVKIQFGVADSFAFQTNIQLLKEKAVDCALVIRFDLSESTTSFSLRVKPDLARDGPDAAAVASYIATVLHRGHGGGGHVAGGGSVPGLHFAESLLAPPEAKVKRGKPIIGVDMDGTVADLRGRLAELLPEHATEIRESTQMDFEGKLEKTTRKVMERKGFYASLPPIECAVQAVKKLAQNYRIVFVTSPLRNAPYCRPEKIQWLEKHFGEMAQQAIFAKDKTLLSLDYLIDDRPQGEGAAWKQIFAPAPWNQDQKPRLLPDWSNIDAFLL